MRIGRSSCSSTLLTMACTVVLHGCGTSPETVARFERVRALRLALEAIDHRFPPPEHPRPDAPETTVIRVLPDATFELANGMIVSMEGVSCAPFAILNLERMLVNRGTTISIVGTPDTARRPTPAMFWVLDRYGAEGKSQSAYSLAADTALMNGWCQPACQPESPQCARYNELAKLATK
jgi:hypothetical protein